MPQPLPVRAAKPVGKGTKLRLGVIGAGNYASSMLLPHLQGNTDVELAVVATATGLSGQNAKLKFGFGHATTRYEEVLEDPSINAVLIATRHSSHAALVCEALRRQKTVYVEKPLALNVAEVAMIRAAILESDNGRLMVGFNRRFSPAIRDIRKRFENSGVPVVVHYRVHAGRLDQGSWYLDASEGTRFSGEAGHFFDTMAYLAGSEPVAVMASTLRPPGLTADDLENVAVVVRYANGSIGNLLYLTQGGSKVPKEVVEVFGGGMTAQLRNFEQVQFFHGTEQERARSTRVDKGQRDELLAFVSAARSGGPMPVPVDNLIGTTLATLAVTESITSGREVLLADYLAALAGEASIGAEEPALHA